MSLHVQALHMMYHWTCEDTISHEHCIEVTLHAKIYRPANMIVVLPCVSIPVSCATKGGLE